MGMARHRITRLVWLVWLVWCVLSVSVARTMDHWIIKDPEGAGAGRHPKRARSLDADASTRPLRTATGSAFATCPVCQRNVPLSLLQGDHIFSAACTLVTKEEKGVKMNVGEEEEISGKASNANTPSPPHQRHQNSSRTTLDRVTFSIGDDRTGFEFTVTPAATAVSGTAQVCSVQSETARHDLQSSLAAAGSPSSSAPFTHTPTDEASQRQPAQPRRQWWTQEAQQQRQVEQPLSHSWWEGPGIITKSQQQLKADSDAKYKPLLDTSEEFSTVGCAAVPSMLWQPHVISNVPGLFQFHDFITEEEEIRIVTALEEQGKQHWKASIFNGECISQVLVDLSLARSLSRTRALSLADFS